MSQGSILKTLKVILFALVIGTPLFYLKWSIYPFSLPRTAYFQTGVELLFVFWLVLCFADKRYRPRLTPLLVSLAAFLGVLLLTAATGADFWRSFWSSEERMVGIFAVLHAAAFSLVLASVSQSLPWRKIFSASLITSAVISILGFLQLLVPNLLVEENPGLRPGSTFGNPAFLASYLLFNIFLAGYLAYIEFKRPGRASAGWLYLGYGGVDLLALITSQTRGAFLGFAFGLLVLFIYFISTTRSSFIRQRLIAVLLLGIFLSAGFVATRRADFWSSVPLLGRLRDFSLGQNEFAPRLSALQAALKGFAERPILGWGAENFNIVFNKFYDPKTLELGYQETRFDKPHNFLAEYLVTGGILLLLAYLWFAFMLTWTLRKIWREVEAERVLVVFLCAALGAYWVENLFLFDTIGSLLMFFLLVGWIEGRAQGQALSTSAAPREEDRVGSSAKPVVLVGSMLIAGLLIYLVNIQTLATGIYQYLGFMTLAKNPAQGIAYFDTATGLSSPYRWAVKRDFAAAITEAYFQNQGVGIPADAVWKGLQGMEEVAAEHPSDAYNHYVLVDMYNQSSDLDPKTLLAKAEKEAQIALALSPKRQEVYFSLAKTKSLEDDNLAALGILQQALTLNPKVSDAHFYYGVIAFAANRPDLGYPEVKQALALGRTWRTHDEARVTANYFADSGHLPEAIELYKKALELDPEDSEAEAKLGIAYFYAGDRDLARQYLARVITGLDIRHSAAYPQLAPILRDLGLASST